METAAKNHVLLCQETESELRELCLECRKKYPIIKEYTEKAILKIRQHRDVVDKEPFQEGRVAEFPLDEVLRAILMACETFQQKIVLLSLSCLQRLIHRRALKDDVIAIVINLMKEQAMNGEEPVQIKVLQTVMATPSQMALISDLVVGQLMELLYILHNSTSAPVHHTACAGLGQLAEKMADRAMAEVQQDAPLVELEAVPPVIRRHPAGQMPSVNAAPAPTTLPEPLRMFYAFVQDLCVMADYDSSNLASRYAVDAHERMRTGWREGYWLNNIKFPRPLCLELLGTCVSAHPRIFTGNKECFKLLRHHLCSALLKNLRGCFDFAILIRSIQLLQQLLKSTRLASLLMPEMQVFLHLMIDLTSAERSPWQRATALEFLKSICEDPKALAVLYDRGTSPTSRDIAASPGNSVEGPRSFSSLVNALSKLIHQVCFTWGMDSAALVNSAVAAGAAAGGGSLAMGSTPSTTSTSTGTGGGGATGASASASASGAGGGIATAPSSSSLGSAASYTNGAAGVFGSSIGSLGSGGSGGGGGGLGGLRGSSNLGDFGRGLLMLGAVNLPQLLGGVGGQNSGSGAGVRDIFAGGGGAASSADGPGSLTRESSGISGEHSSGGGVQARSSSKPQKLLLLMNETEPPAVQPMLLVQLLIDSVMSLVLSLYRILLDCDEDAPTSPGGATSSSKDGDGHQPPRQHRHVTPLKLPLSPEQEKCQHMVAECWSSLLSALSLMVHFTNDEVYLPSTLTCLQTLLFCCSRLSLHQAREACMIQLSKYASAGQHHELEGAGDGRGNNLLSSKNVLCVKALIHFCSRYGGLLGAEGWKIALAAFTPLEKTMQRSAQTQSGPDSGLRSALDSLFETTAFLPEASLLDVVQAMAHNAKTTTSVEDGTVLMNRFMEVCTYNLNRLPVLWPRMLQMVLDICASEDQKALRMVAVGAICRVLSEALKKGALAMLEDPEAEQAQLLGELEVLLTVPHEDVRARVCESLLGILHTSGQELDPRAWATMVKSVAFAARGELERVGLFFLLPSDSDLETAVVHTKARTPATSGSNPNNPSNNNSKSSNGSAAAASGTTSPSEAEGPPKLRPRAGPVVDVRDPPQVVPTVFQLLELVVQDFLEYVPTKSVRLVTASIGAFARFNGLGVNSSLTAVGFLWNVADALARYHCPQPGADGQAIGAEATAAFEELWVQIFTHLRVLALDLRPEVRNCAVKSLTSALLSHGRKIGKPCYQRCLRDILIEVMIELQNASIHARNGGQRSASAKAPGMLVHHSRDTPEKQWNETVVLAVEGVRRVLSHFSDEAGVQPFAPLAYRVLLEMKATLGSLNSDLAGAALRALVDLMRIPASSQLVAASVLDEVPDPSGDALVLDADGMTSLWLGGWGVLWKMAKQCMTTEVPESLMETFEKALSSLRSSHAHCFSPGQHLITVMISLVLSTAPVFYLPNGIPLPEANSEEGRGAVVDLAQAVQECAKEALAAGNMTSLDQEVFQFASDAPKALWSLGVRMPPSHNAEPSYSKKPAEVKSFIETNASRNTQIRSMEHALRSTFAESGNMEEATQAFLGPGASPTHRTMLHISSARLQHVQGFVFGLLEDTPGFEEPTLATLFFLLCSSMFLDHQNLLQDTNRFALASRALCLMVMFCRRTFLVHLSRLALPGVDPETLAQEASHLEALVGKAVPQVLKVLQSLAFPQSKPLLRRSGLWKLAMEAGIYIIDDSQLALSQSMLTPDAARAYWEAVLCFLQSSLASCEEIVGSPDVGSTATASEVAGATLLAQALGDLCAHQILPKENVSEEVSCGAIAVLEGLARVQSNCAWCAATLEPPPQAGANQGSGQAPAPAPDSSRPKFSNLGHLFDLCTQANPTDSQGEDEEEDSALFSVVALVASGRSPSKSQRAVAKGNLAGVAAPALLQRLRKIISKYVAEEQQKSPSQVKMALEEETLFALERLSSLHASEAAYRAAGPQAPQSAKSACELAARQAFAMALLPQLSSLVTSPMPSIRSAVRRILEALSAELCL